LSCLMFLSFCRKLIVTSIFSSCISVAVRWFPPRATTTRRTSACDGSAPVRLPKGPAAAVWWIGCDKVDLALFYIMCFSFG
jgi:hypothetical protein